MVIVLGRVQQHVGHRHRHRRAEQCQRATAVRMTLRELPGDQRAHAVTNDRGSLDASRVEHLREPVGHGRDCRPGCSGAATVARAGREPGRASPCERSDEQAVPRRCGPCRRRARRRRMPHRTRACPTRCPHRRSHPATSMRAPLMPVPLGAARGPSRRSSRVDPRGRLRASPSLRRCRRRRARRRPCGDALCSPGG